MEPWTGTVQETGLDDMDDIDDIDDMNDMDDMDDIGDMIARKLACMLSGGARQARGAGSTDMQMMIVLSPLMMPLVAQTDWTGGSSGVAVVKVAAVQWQQWSVVAAVEW